MNGTIDTRKKKPASIFERIFLSHLLLIAAMFGAMVWLYDYLVGSSYRIILQHDPQVIIPVVLILIGIAGVLSAGLSRAIALPMEKAGERLASGAAPDPRTGLEEVETLMHQLADWVETEKRHGSTDTTTGTGTVTAGQPSLDEKEIRDLFLAMKRPVGILANLLDEQLLATYDPAGYKRIERMKEQIAYLLLLANRGIDAGETTSG